MLFAYIRRHEHTLLSPKRIPSLVGCNASREYFVDRFTYSEVAEMLVSKNLILSLTPPRDRLLLLVDLGDERLDRAFVEYAISILTPPGPHNFWDAEESSLVDYDPTSMPVPRAASRLRNYAECVLIDLRMFRRLIKEGGVWP
jgi:hypothetical protein